MPHWYTENPEMEGGGIENNTHTHTHTSTPTLTVDVLAMKEVWGESTYLIESQSFW